MSIISRFRALQRAAKQRAIVRRVEQRANAEANLALDDQQFHRLSDRATTELLEKRPEPPTAEVRAQYLQPEDVAAAVLFALSLPERACVAELTLLPNALQVLGRT